MPLSPLFLLLTHAPYRNLSASEKAQLVESVQAAAVDPTEREVGQSLLDRFLQRILSSNSARDSLFVHDIVCALLEKGVPATLSSDTASRFFGRLPLARALLENHRQPSADTSFRDQLRLGSALLDEVFVSRASSETLAGIDTVLEKHGPNPMVGGLPAVLWLGMHSGPTNAGNTHPSGGWMFEGSASEAATHGGRVFRGLRTRLESLSSASPSHRWLMDAWALSWVANLSPSDKVKLAHPILQRPDATEDMLGQLDATAQLAATFDAPLKARVAAAMLRAAPVLAATLGKLGSMGREAERVEHLAAALTVHGMSLAWQDGAWLLENDVLGSPLGLASQHNRHIVRRVAGSEEGLKLSIRLWVATGLGSSFKILPGARQEWLSQVLRAGRSAPKRLLRALDEVGPGFDEALENAGVSGEIEPILARIRSLRLSAALPEQPEQPARSSRPRM